MKIFLALLFMFVASASAKPVLEERQFLPPTFVCLQFQF